MGKVPESSGSFFNVGVLLGGGDWACAHGNAGTLAEIARQLCPCVTLALQQELEEISRLAMTDLLAATTRWAELHDYLRAHPNGFSSAHSA